MIKRVCLTMVVYFVIMFFFGAVLEHYMSSSVYHSYFFPVYAGLTLLAGVCVGCTNLIWYRLDEIEEKLDGTTKEADSGKTEKEEMSEKE